MSANRSALPVPTPHIAAAAGAFAADVLLPGDPLRARYIAEQFLEDARCVTSLRGMLGYSGVHRGRAVSVMGTGMGLPSCMLYATELVRGYGVRRLLRVGTCGAVRADVALGELLVALGAGTDSRANRLRFGGHDCPATASWPLLQALQAAALRAATPLRFGNVFSTDHFHALDPQLTTLLQGAGVLGVEMEAAGLYAVAAELGVEAAALLTVSDHLVQDAHMDPAARERGLDRMIALALDALVPADSGDTVTT